MEERKDVFVRTLRLQLCQRMSTSMNNTAQKQKHHTQGRDQRREALYQACHQLSHFSNLELKETDFFLKDGAKEFHGTGHCFVLALENVKAKYKKPQQMTGYKND